MKKTRNELKRLLDPGDPQKIMTNLIDSIPNILDDDVYKQWVGTQEDYDALGVYDDKTIYNIIE
jgi:hypothetical protein